MFLEEKLEKILAQQEVILENQKKMDEKISSLHSRGSSASTKPVSENMTTKQAIAYLGISTDTLARYKRDRRIPVCSMGGRNYYRKSDLDK